MQNLIPTLQVSIGPVILISGVGLLLLSMTNRLGRAIDRARQLKDAYRHGTEADRARIKGQLEILWRRACFIRAAIVWGSAAVLLVSLVIILLFTSSLFGVNLAPIIAILFGCCMIAVVVSLIYFIQDINYSLHALRLEINFEDEK